VYWLKKLISDVDGSCVGYRVSCYTGTFDIAYELALKLNINESLVTSVDTVSELNDLLVTQDEKVNGIVPEISNNIALAIKAYKEYLLYRTIIASKIPVVIEDSKSGRVFYLRMLEKYKGELNLDTSAPCNGFTDVIKALKVLNSPVVILVFDFALNLADKLKLINKIKNYVRKGRMVFYFTPQCFEEVLLSCNSSNLHSPLIEYMMGYLSSGDHYLNQCDLINSHVTDIPNSILIDNSIKLARGSNLENIIASEIAYVTKGTELEITKGRISERWYTTISSNNSILGGLVNMLDSMQGIQEKELSRWSQESKNKLYGGVLYVKDMDR